MKYCRHYQTECQWEGSCDIAPCRGVYTFDGINYKDANIEESKDCNVYTEPSDPYKNGGWE